MSSSPIEPRWSISAEIFQLRKRIIVPKCARKHRSTLYSWSLIIKHRTARINPGSPSFPDRKIQYYSLLTRPRNKTKSIVICSRTCSTLIKQRGNKEVIFILILDINFRFKVEVYMNQTCLLQQELFFTPPHIRAHVRIDFPIWPECK